MNCPNCLGTGTVPQVIKDGPGRRHVDLQGVRPKVTCLICHGSGQEPEWLKAIRLAETRGGEYVG